MLLLLASLAFAEEPRLSDLLGPWTVTRTIRRSSCPAAETMGEQGDVLPPEVWTLVQMTDGRVEMIRPSTPGATQLPLPVIIEQDGIRVEGGWNALWLAFTGGARPTLRGDSLRSAMDGKRPCAVVSTIEAVR